MTGPGNEWFDEDAGPLVRSYALTGGRARPANRESFPMMANVATVARPAGAHPGVGPEHIAIIELCLEPLSVAEVSARLRLPLVVVRVLLGDLVDQGFVTIRRPRLHTRGGVVTQDLLREVLHGLEAL
jgi:hypothetical protein